MKDVEYVASSRGRESAYLASFDEAAAKAVQFAIASGEATIDVLVYSEDGAAAFGGDDAVERYRDDPDASVFERIIIKANNVGRVP